MPNLPLEQDFRSKVKAAYQVVERGGLVYVYMGMREMAPPLPAFEALLCPPEETLVTCRQRECDWVQALEGDIDPSHFSFLHTGAVKVADIDLNHSERF
jgi:phenylpropionate dioxygenase-like ring-hydroxylating dioxygenase large terminal subunit